MIKLVLVLFLCIGLLSQLPFIKRKIIYNYSIFVAAWIIFRCKTGCDSTEKEMKPCLLHEDKIRHLEHMGKKNG